MAKTTETNAPAPASQEGTAPSRATRSAAPANEGQEEAPDLGVKVGELEALVADLGNQLAALPALEQRIKDQQADLDLLPGLRDQLKAETEAKERLQAIIEEGVNAPDNEQEIGSGGEDAGYGRNRLARAFLLSVLIALPANLRLTGLGARLDELEIFVSQFEGDDRYAAVEMIKAVATARPNDVISGAYKIDVLKAFAVLDGVDENSVGSYDPASEQKAALNRLGSVLGSNPVPSGFNAEPLAPPSADVVLDGTDDQNAALAGLYSGGRS